MHMSSMLTVVLNPLTSLLIWLSLWSLSTWGLSTQVMFLSKSPAWWSLGSGSAGQFARGTKSRRPVPVVSDEQSKWRWRWKRFFFCVQYIDQHVVRWGNSHEFQFPEIWWYVECVFHVFEANSKFLPDDPFKQDPDLSHLVLVEKLTQLHPDSETPWRKFTVGNLESM